MRKLGYQTSVWNWVDLVKHRQRCIIERENYHHWTIESIASDWTNFDSENKCKILWPPYDPMHRLAQITNILEILLPSEKFYSAKLFQMNAMKRHIKETKMPWPCPLSSHISASNNKINGTRKWKQVSYSYKTGFVYWFVRHVFFTTSNIKCTPLNECAIDFWKTISVKFWFSGKLWI